MSTAWHGKVRHSADGVRMMRLLAWLPDARYDTFFLGDFAARESLAGLGQTRPNVHHPIMTGWSGRYSRAMPPSWTANRGMVATVKSWHAAVTPPRGINMPKVR